MRFRLDDGVSGHYLYGPVETFRDDQNSQWTDARQHHTKTVALYRAEQGWKIRCNSIHPAAVLTPMWEPMLGHGDERYARMDSIVRDTPLRRFGTVEEVAALAIMLASDEVTYITGAEHSYHAPNVDLSFRRHERTAALFMLTVVMAWLQVTK